jgi:hypothetical protein
MKGRGSTALPVAYLGKEVRGVESDLVMTAVILLLLIRLSDRL